jgi:hypothetical protein
MGLKARNTELGVHEMGKATVVMTLGVGYDARRAKRLEARVSGMKGVDAVEYNHVVDRITVTFDPDLLDPTRLQSIIAQERSHRLSPAVRQGEGAKQVQGVKAVHG